MKQQEFLARYRYEVRSDRLGGGSFGTVYKAYDTTRDRYVAIKVSEVRTVGGKTYSLEDELAAVAALPEHRNLAHYERVYQFETPAGIFDYAVMQYYPAGNLRELLDRGGLSGEQRAEIGRGLLRGLAHLHRHQVVHRDLKPSNVLMAQVGDLYIPKIADFGLSKRVEEGSRFSNSLAGGTLAYSAPEQLLGKPIRLNADLWSAGVMLFELFLGYRPFRPQGEQGSSAARDRDLYDQIVHAPLPAEVERLPAPFAAVVRAFLVRDPELRTREILPAWTEEGGGSGPPADEKTVVDLGKESVQEPAPAPVVTPAPVVEPQVEAVAVPPVVQPPPEAAQQGGASDKMTVLALWLVPLVIAAMVGLMLWGGGQEQADLRPTESADGRWGYTDAAGSWVLPARYDSAGPFESGRAQVLRGDSLLWITQTGRVEEVLREPAAASGPSADGEAAAWSAAQAEDAEAAYEAYLATYPDRAHAEAARERLAEIRAEAAESAAWSRAKRRNDAAHYEEYLSKYPEGAHVKEARERLAEIRAEAAESAAWSRATSRNDAAHYEEYLSKYPEGAHAKEARRRLGALTAAAAKKRCGAYVAPGEWKAFLCHNLGSANTEADPFTPSWEIIGGYWQWGRKGPARSFWRNTNTAHFAHGPTGPRKNQANTDPIPGWSNEKAVDGAWADGYKTSKDPCPTGYRVPTRSDWEGVLEHNEQRTVGTWDADAANYSSGRFFGSALMLPAAGNRNSYDGALFDRGYNGNYWSSAEDGSGYAWYLNFRSGNASTRSYYRTYGRSVRCAAE